MKIHGTAKGGALATKNFGVAFGGAAACVEATYNDLPDETLNANPIVGVGRIGVALQINSGHVLVDKLVKSVTVKLDNDTRSPSETIFVRARDSSGAIVGTFGERDATTLTSSIVEYTFDTNEITLSVDDMITLEYPITSGDAIVTRVYRDTIDYVANATALVSTTDLTSWAAFTFGTNYWWVWMSVVYCE